LIPITCMMILFPVASNIKRRIPQPIMSLLRSCKYRIT
jgi:hypothetical protein